MQLSSIIQERARIVPKQYLCSWNPAVYLSRSEAVFLLQQTIEIQLYFKLFYINLKALINY